MRANNNIHKTSESTNISIHKTAESSNESKYLYAQKG